jgi:hypothetical protein
MTLLLIVLLLLLGGRLVRAAFWVAAALFLMGCLTGAHLLVTGAPWRFLP